MPRGFDPRRRGKVVRRKTKITEIRFVEISFSFTKEVFVSTEPVGAPQCWGKQFGDEDEECQNCSFNVSCRPATINHVSKSQRSYLPSPTPRPQSSVFTLPVVNNQYQTPHLQSPPPLPQPTYSRPAVGQPLPNAPLPIPTLPPNPGYHQQQTFFPPGWNAPIAYLPRPAMNNGNWWQYQNESTGQRLVKNVLLSMFQAAVAELLRFLTNWTWPAKPTNG